MMNNSKFRAIPRTEFKIPFKLEEHTISSWLNRLTKYDGKEACLQILLLLQALNNTECKIKNKIIILNIINDNLIKYISAIDHNCWDAGMPLSADEMDYAEIITWNCLTLAQSFFISSTDNTSALYYLSSADKKADEAFPLCTALQLLRQAQLHIAAVYCTPDDGFWQLAYQIFNSAEKRKLLDVIVNKSQFKNTTLNALFKQILIFHVCNTNQFRPRELRIIFKFLPDVCNAISIFKTVEKEENSLLDFISAFSSKKEKEYDKDSELFFIELDSDNPPTSLKKTPVTQSDAVRYFSPVSVVNAIIEQSNNLKTELAKNVSETIVQRIVKTLGQGQKRKFSRKNKNYTTPCVIGFDYIIKFLRKDALETITNELAEQQTDKKITIFSLEDNIKQGGNVVSLVPIREVTIFDSSAKGYLLSWHETDIKTKVGDIFGIVAFDNAKCLELGLIRRIIMNTNDDFKFGTEIIGRATEVVYVSYPGYKNTGDWGILISDELQQPASLIYPLNFFKIGHEICVYKGKEKSCYLLAKELNSSVSITHAQLEYLDSKIVS